MDWVSIQPELDTWLTSDTSSLLWISGSPGQGKSVLCKHLLGLLETKVKDRVWMTAKPSVIYFFCSGQLDAQFKNAATILKTLIVQLLSSPHMFEHLPEQHKNGAEKFQTAPRESLWGIFSDMIYDNHSQYTYCLIDAVDEFGEMETQGLLERIQDLFAGKKTSDKGKFKFLLTSRPEAYISRCLTKAVTMHLQARRENIQQLVDAKVEALSSVFEGSKSEIKKQLGAQAGSTFLWVDIIVKRINRLTLPNWRKIKREIDDTPIELQELYKKLTHKICEDEDNARLLIWVLYARRPLNLRELEIALAVRPEERSDSIEGLQEIKTVLTEELVKDSAGLLLEIKYGAVYLIHQSAKDFLFSNFSSIFMEHGTGNRFLHNIDAETFLASSCVRYLSFRDFESQDLFKAVSFSGRRKFRRRETPKYFDQYPFLKYASKYWYQHIRTPDQTLSFSEDLRKILDPTNYRTRIWCLMAFGRAKTSRNLTPRAEIAIDLDLGWLAKTMLLDATTLPEDRFPVGSMAKAAANGSEVIRVLVEFGTPYSSGITTGVLRAAARNMRSGKEVTELLLKHCALDISVTPDIVAIAAGNSKTGFQITKLLLDRYGAEISITEDIVAAAAGNSTSGFQITELLLDRYGAEIPITPDIINAAVRNGESGFQITELLLHRYGAEISITADIVAAAASNSTSGFQITELLLDRYGAEICITADIVAAAAAAYNMVSGYQIMGLLLARCGDETEITEKILQVANGAPGRDDFIQLALKGASATQITPDLFRVLLTTFRAKTVDQLFNEFLVANETEGWSLLNGLPEFQRFPPTLVRFKNKDGWRYLSMRKTHP
jgi:hypothetical protein